MRWRLRGLTSLHWLHLDGDWAIYDDGSGQTISIDRVMAAALMALESGCATPAEIEAQVRHDLSSDPGDELAGELTEGLAFLHRLGLIEEAPTP